MTVENTAPSVLKTKPHFNILDGLRGIAALAVVIFHFMEWVFPDYNQNFIGHGFLAVDFFFCLSGFVIGYAYDNRMPQMGLKNFFALRLIRLHPLVVLGTVLGVAGFLLDPFSNAYTSYNTGRVLLLFMSSIMLIPMPAMEDRGFNLFGLNAPSWSLFWEYIANIIYAFILCRIKRSLLIIITISAAILLCYVSYRSGNLLGGWSGETFWDGGTRLAYSFSAGILIYRSNWIIKNNIGFIGLTVLLSLAFIMPGTSFNWLTELLVVLFYFPLIVSLGAGAALNPKMKNICVFSGNISYPLYMTHYAAIWIFGNYYTGFKPSMDKLPFIIIPGIFFLVAFAWLVMKFYDIPVRKYLKKKFVDS
ncbi:acyltransferase family protein [Parafilimonas terrae]|uniref:Peptidoglycan/LPS O-acetylase OafA/YrhL, contains acyltransferase and SGNH-hydrolase domains n=1 Tax=Parafilimonas terrae TaxID=1465490 RepID=A0A1I5ZC63_9BACT|nr:acyltransferase [Parafilimonas terrae]SFQ54015.1 Peptidoglycan/LPS O-acetylase OafA/YrhL, contains acyltransferase and SGNH-hydrolase domains [Parafilimonas terrae]